MISSQDYNLLWVSYFKSKQQADNFTALTSTIDIISHEEIPIIPRDDIVVLVLFIFITHLLEHVK